MRPPIGTKVDIIGGKYRNHTGTVQKLLPVWVTVRLEPNPSSPFAPPTLNRSVNIPGYQLRIIIPPTSIPEEPHEPVSLVSGSGIPTSTLVLNTPLPPMNIPPSQGTTSLPLDRLTTEMEFIARLGAMSISQHPTGPVDGLSTFLEIMHQFLE